MEKLCPRCKITKQVEEFHSDATTKDKLARICKVCKKKDAKKYRDSHREIIREKKRIENNDPANKSRRRERGYREGYGITTADYNRMFSEQNGRCAICRSESSKTSNSPLLFVDHCHDSGTIRGLLCSLCNRGLGAFEDCHKIVQAAANYLAKYAQEKYAIPSLISSSPDTSNHAAGESGLGFSPEKCEVVTAGGSMMTAITVSSSA